MPQENESPAETSIPAINAERLLAFARKHQVYLGLIVILAFGAYLRSYHMDYPSIGYHNMKENEYLSMAHHYFHEGFSLERKVFFYDDRDFDTYAQVPLISYVAALVWEVTGENVWSVRLQMILFSLGSIFLSFVLTQQLSKDKTLSLLTALVMAILPLNVFFWEEHPTGSSGVGLPATDFCLVQPMESPAFLATLPPDRACVDADRILQICVCDPLDCLACLDSLPRIVPRLPVKQPDS